MTTLHAKSPCCQGSIYQHGQRRRRCSLCGKTWRIRPANRGRKRLRLNPQTLLRYLDNKIGPFVHQASRHRLNPSAFCKRIQKMLKRFVSRETWPAVPKDHLVVVADALIQMINGQTWTVYFILLRPIHSSLAVIFPPYFRLGKETCRDGWREAFERVAEGIRGRILALICDGASGLVGQAKRRGWIIQRCHFHIKHKLANYIRTGPLSRNREVGLRVNALVNTVLLSENVEKVQDAIRVLRYEIFPDIKSHGLRKYLRGFLKNYQDFRSYLSHPELNLPNTSNSAESLVGLVRDIQRRARGFRTLESFQDWIIAICKNKKTIVCNGKFHRIK